MRWRERAELRGIWSNKENFDCAFDGFFFFVVVSYLMFPPSLSPPTLVADGGGLLEDDKSILSDPISFRRERQRDAAGCDERRRLHLSGRERIGIDLVLVLHKRTEFPPFTPIGKSSLPIRSIQPPRIKTWR